MRAIVIAIVAVACSSSSPRTTSTMSRLSSTPTSCNVVDYGATPNDASDDRAAIQAAIDACEVVELPGGTFIVGRSPLGYWGIETRSRTRLRGVGRMSTVLKMAPGSASSTRIIKASGDDVTIESLTLDGDRAAQTVNSQRHGLFATGVRRLTIRDVLAQNFTGDGLYLHADNSEVTIGPHVTCSDNDRNGLTIGATTTGVSVAASSFVDNAKQQFDSEPGGTSRISEVTITGSVFDARGKSNEYVLTISGASNANPGRDWTVWGNVINGGVYVVWADGITIANNIGRNATTKASVTVARRSRDVSIIGNRFTMTQAAVGGLAGIHVYGAGVGDTPGRVLVAGNSIDMSQSHEYNFGVSVTGAISATIMNNTLRGAGRPATYSSGVYVRATIVDEDFRSAVVSGNWISDFGQYAISVNGNGNAKLLALVADGNLFDASDGSPMTIGIAFDKTGAVQSARAVGNTRLGGMTTMISSPAGMVVAQ